MATVLFVTCNLTFGQPPGGGNQQGGQQGPPPLPTDKCMHPRKLDSLKVDKTGFIINYIKLDKDDFPQPEGITFSAKGDIYISSEGISKGGLLSKVIIGTKT